jgi:hypothetical protein
MGLAGLQQWAGKVSAVHAGQDPTTDTMQFTWPEYATWLEV